MRARLLISDKTLSTRKNEFEGHLRSQGPLKNVIPVPEPGRENDVSNCRNAVELLPCWMAYTIGAAD